MILVVTHSKDMGADLVIRQLRARGAEYRRLDTDQLGTPACHAAFDDGPELNGWGSRIPASAIKAVWHRRFAEPAVLASVIPGYRRFAARELATVFDAFLDSITGLHVNRHEADRLAGNRLIQAERARAIGFLVPPTLVTQDPERAGAFIAAHPVITKALGYGLMDEQTGASVHTSLVTEPPTLDEARGCPVLLQERVPKRREWRITTVGQQIFSARTRHDRDVDPVDWRLSSAPAEIFEPATLPGAVGRMTLDLCARSGLAFATHDLIEAPSGDFYFLETNPAGQWGWLELTIGLPIAAALTSLLINADRGSD